MAELEIAKEIIANGKTALGIEFGSTRIKAVLIDEAGNTLAVGTYDWENELQDGLWTYAQTDIFAGLKACYASLKTDVQEKFGVTLTTIGAMGISAMMHGYLAFNKEGDLLVPFRTWRNTNTTKAAHALTELFSFHIPERWSIAHLYQAMLDQEPHINQVASITTLAGYVSRELTGENILSVGDASGMFPVRRDANNTPIYDPSFVTLFDETPEAQELDMHVAELLPKIRVAGQTAGKLTEKGAALLDDDGDLQAGIPVAPAEGDAGTGMIATNSVAPRTGNVSAGTSVFSMTVMDKPLPNPKLNEIDIVATPSGDPVAMVHCNNCTSDLNAWMDLFSSYNELMGVTLDTGALFTKLFNAALLAEKDAGGLCTVPFVSGEPIMADEAGRPLFAREPTAKMSIADFMRAQIMSCFGALKVGNDILLEQGVMVDVLYGHGGIFKTPLVAQSILAAAMQTAITVYETAGEGGAWGEALAALYMLQKQSGQSASNAAPATQTLGQWLEATVFSKIKGETVQPDTKDIEGFNRYIDVFKQLNAAEKTLVNK